MDVGSLGQGKAVPPTWILLHGTDIVDRGIIVLFFGLFSLPPPPLEIFLSTPLRLQGARTNKIIRNVII